MTELSLLHRGLGGFFSFLFFFFFAVRPRDPDSDSVNTMVVHEEEEGNGGDEERAGGYGDQTMLVQRVRVCGCVLGLTLLYPIGELL